MNSVYILTAFEQTLLHFYFEYTTLCNSWISATSILSTPFEYGMTRIGNTTIINVLIGIVIGFCISYLFSTNGLSNDVTPLRYFRVAPPPAEHHHDAHDESDMNDSEAPEKAIHFHGNESGHRKFTLIFSYLYNFSLF